LEWGDLLGITIWSYSIAVRLIYSQGKEEEEEEEWERFDVVDPR
jgi:hypothetical protein